MPVIWRVEGDNIHPNGGSVNYFEKKAEAGRAVRAFNKKSSGGKGPIQVKLAGRPAIIAELQRAMACARGATLDDDGFDATDDLL